MSEAETKARAELISTNRALRGTIPMDANAADMDAYRRKRDAFNKASRILIAVICQENP